jgi:hypothetical protein
LFERRWCLLTSPPVPHSFYEAKQEARRLRLEAHAEKAAAEAQAHFKRADAISSMIPFGQPILVGHHSEKRHRADLARIHKGMDKGVEATRKADRLQRRAAAVGSAGVSSDDPDAVDKLKTKLEKLEKAVAHMKSANAALRRQDHDALVGLGFSDAQVLQLREPDFAGRVGFPDYAFTNTGTEIRRVRARIQRLERQQLQQTRSYLLEDGTRIVRNVEANRVQIITPAKPDDGMRRQLKSHGFRWAPSVGAWQRHLSDNAMWQACHVLGIPFPPPAHLIVAEDPSIDP